MVTIKTIAQKANVSPSTVSIILNGKAKERKISSETQKKVWNIIADIGYRPNVQAVSLRTSPDTSLFRIVIFWISDSRAQTMVRFFQSIETLILHQNYPCEVLLRSYLPEKLNEVMTEELIRSCHGIIICNASETDLEFLERTSFARPVVLYNRYSKKYTTVTMDDRTIGSMPAKILASHHKRKPAAIISPATFNGMNLRTNLFCYTCLEYGMQQPWIYTAENTESGGYNATLLALQEHPDMDCIFYSGDNLALGALRVFHQAGISIPDKIEFLAVGTSVRERCEMYYPSVSVIYLPIEDAARKCLESLYRLMTYQTDSIESIHLPVTYIARESCPPETVI